MTRYILPILFSLFLVGATYYVKERRANISGTSQEARTATIATPREEWAVALLRAVGNGAPSAAIVAEVVAWSIAEDGGDGALARNNLWNTTMCGFNQLGAINSDGACGVGHYATMEDGIAANAATLAQANFADIRAALLANDVAGFRTALWASGWAASHYNYGVGWPAYRMEAPQARVSSKCLPTDTGAISAHFHDTASQYWSAQAGGEHNGTDYAGSQGDPVYAPFNLTVEDIQYYSDPARIGWYVQGRFDDGYLFYAGHLGTVAVSVGERVAACAVIGTIGEVFHTHIKLADPSMPIPCEATGCVDFETYYQEH